MSIPTSDSATPRRAPSSAAWPGFLLRGALVAAAAELVAAAVARVVLQVDPGVLAPAPTLTLLRRAFVVAAGATLALIVLDSLLGLLLGALARWRPAYPDPRESRAEVAWLLLLALMAPWALTRWSFGAAHAGHALGLPVLARTVSGVIPWLVAALGAEVLLRLARLWRGTTPAWWGWRGLLGLGWALILLKVLTGPNLLIGDPLEWARPLRDAHLSQEWLARAPRAPARWWPAVQLACTVGLLMTLLAAAREFWLGWRARRGGANAAPGPH